MVAVAERIGSQIDRFVEVGTIVLISLAAVATAWCGYQAARWSETAAFEYNRANAGYVLAASIAARANAMRVLDVTIFGEYEAAEFRHEQNFAAFIRRRFPAELRTAYDAWLATNPLSNTHAPLSPFAMPQYRLRLDAKSEDVSRQANAAVTRAVEAAEAGDGYLFITVLFASVTFLGGVAIKARRPWDAVLTAVGTVFFFVSLARLLHYPVH